MTADPPEESWPALEIIWSRKALARLRETQQYIATDKPGAATRLALRIVSVVAALRVHPHVGRAGSQPPLRELIIGGTPYIVIYKVGRKRLTILTIWHGAQESRSGD
ncbi:MAG: type II toxin-antitoxin system RelE/ParE family toxin [Candidatus Korobacteraceae bacterium]